MDQISPTESSNFQTPASQKVILLVEANVNPHFLNEVLSSASETRVSTLSEEGCEAMFQTFREGDPCKIVFFEVFSSPAAHAFHLDQEYTRAFFSFIEGKLDGEATFTKLSHV